jgi:Uma2 family endonuclease
MAAASTTEHRWTCDEVERAAAAGILGSNDHVELLDGELVYKLDYCPQAAAFYRDTGLLLRRLWTRAEQRELLRLGILRPGESVELAEGDVQPVMTQKAPHPTAVQLTADALGRVFNQGCHVREEKPFRLPDQSEPEPDVVVVPGTPRDYSQQHPTVAWLLVEVAERSLDYDRTDQASQYARAGITDYWIVNLVDRQLEIRRDPAPMPSEPHGHGYRTVQIIPANGSASPLIRPEVQIAVADLLP